MKKSYVLILIMLVAIIKLNAQPTTLLTGVEKASDLIVHNNHLYYLQGSFNPSSFTPSNHRKLFKYNLSTSSTSNILTLSGSYGLLLADDTTLYISGNNGVYKTNITEEPLTPTLVISPTEGVIYRGMEMQGDEIYVITRNHGIYKFNKTDASPSLTTVTNPIGTAYDIEIIDSTLFIADYGGNQISKINLNSTLPATPVFVASISKPLGIDYWNGKLYVTSETTNSIYNFNPNQINPTLNTVISSGLIGPDIGLEFYNNNMYIAEYGANRISQFSISTVEANLVVDSNASCNGASDGGVTALTTQGTPPFTYLWNTGDTTSTLSGISSGMYTVQIEDNNGFTLVDSILVTEPIVLTAAVNIDSNTTCFGYSNGGATVGVTGGTPPYTYQWSNGALTASITGVQANLYTVTVTDANGCSTFNSGTINQLPPSQSFDYVNAINSFEWIDGTIYTESTYGPTYTFTNIHGCDSIVTLQLNIVSYCSSRSTRNRFEWIKQVELESDIDNLSHQDANGYGDYTTQVLNVDTGDVVTVNLTPGYKRRAYVEYWRIWADWNYDGDYNDPDEKVFEQKGKNVRTGSFTIPTNVDPNTLGLRVSMRWKRYAPSCGNFRNGEVEDYRILVNGAQGSPYNEQDGKFADPEEQSTETFFEFADVFPNPVVKGDYISGYLRTEQTGQHQIRLINALGQLIKTQELYCEEGENRFEISTKTLTTGLYFMNINGGSETVKIIVR